MQKIVFFDGVCNLCAHSVQYIIKNDASKSILFASLQSKFAMDTVPTEPAAAGSVVFFDGTHYHTKSRAIMKICMIIGGKHIILGWFLKLLPLVIADFLYDVVARHRYWFFGKKTECWLPDNSRTAG